MKSSRLLVGIISLFSPFALVADTLSPVPPMPFIENLGQVYGTDNALHSEVEYYTDVDGHRAYFFAGGIAHVWHMRDTVTDQDTLYRLDTYFSNYNSGVSITTEENDTLPGQLNYMLGYLPDNVTGVRMYNKIKYEELYPYTDLTVSNNGVSLMYNFHLVAGSSLSNIMMDFQGATDVDLDEKGALIVTTPYGMLHYDKPTAYVTSGSRQNIVAVEYVVEGTKVSFSAEEELDNGVDLSFGRLAYPPSSPVMPVINQELFWSTYFGTTGGTEMHDSYIDAAGELYIAGGTAAGLFPDANSLAIVFAGGFDGIVAKFTIDRQLLYVTWAGGSAHDEAWSIVGDLSGNPCFTGPTTSSDFPDCSAFSCTTAVQSYPGNQAAFYMKLDNSSFGSQVEISTFLGYNCFPNGVYAITCDGSDNVYVGISSLYDVMVPVVSLTNAYNQSTAGGSEDVYIAKFNSSNVQVWGTYFGGSGDDMITALTTDANDHLYVLGYSSSPTASQNCGTACTSNANPGYFPIANPQNSVAYQQQLYASLQRDAFLIAFDANDALLWSTMIGGGGDDGYSEGHDGGIAVDDATGAIYIASSTKSDGFSGDIPVTPSTQPANTDVYWQDASAGGSSDAFIAKFTPSYELIYCSYYGGDGYDLGSDLTIGHALGATEVYFSGGIFMSTYTTFPTYSQGYFYENAADGMTQGYVVMFYDDPDDYTALPEMGWASCINGNGGNTAMWYVSAADSHLVVGGWCHANLQPAPVYTPPAFIQPTEPCPGHNGCILEFILHSCMPCSRLANPATAAEPSVYPNPSSDGMFTAAVPETMQNKELTVTVCDVLGKVVYTETMTAEYPITIDLSDQPEGVYFLQMSSGEETEVVRMVNQKSDQ